VFVSHNTAASMMVSSEMKEVIASKLFLRTVEPGQSLVEFAIILPLFLLMTLVFIQLILIGVVALAVNQAAASCVRYAALNNTYKLVLSSSLEGVVFPTTLAVSQTMVSNYEETTGLQAVQIVL
jgi:TadE-like protein